MTEDQRQGLIKTLNKRIRQVTDRNESYLADEGELAAIALATTALIQLHQLGDLTPQTPSKNGGR